MAWAEPSAVVPLLIHSEKHSPRNASAASRSYTSSMSSSWLELARLALDEELVPHQARHRWFDGARSSHTQSESTPVAPFARLLHHLRDELHARGHRKIFCRRACSYTSLRRRSREYPRTTQA